MGQKVEFTKTGMPVKHGTNNAYSNHGCRCTACRIARRYYHQAYLYRSGRRTPWAEFQASRPRAGHGHQAKYKRGCRCDVCVEWARLDRAKHRARQGSEPTPKHVHGTTNGYQNWGCRCERCTQASREHYQRYKMIKKQTGSVR